jgi:hypothetical protein
MKTHTIALARIGLALAVAACAKPGDDTGGTPGSIGIALVTTGADGATYRLTPGTRLSLTQAGDGAVWDFPLDGDGAVVTLRVPPGDYNAEIYNDSGFTTQWPLDRSGGGEPSTTVTATLVSAQPASVTVVSGETASLVFQFSVGTAGMLTFDRGSVDVSIGVSEQPATHFSTSATGTGDVTGGPVFGAPYDQTLPAIMPAAGATGLQISVSGQLSGAWAGDGGGSPEAGFYICAPMQISSVSASGNDGFAALIAETGHGSAPAFGQNPASLCVIDYGDGIPNQVRIRLSREGVAETPTLANVLGTAPALFHHQVLGDLPVRVYDAAQGTFDGNALLGTRTLPMTLKTQIRNDSDFSVFWYNERITGQMTFSFVGTP